MSTRDLLVRFVDGRATRAEVERALADGTVEDDERDALQGLLAADRVRSLASIEPPEDAIGRLREQARRAADEPPKEDVLEQLVLRVVDELPGAREQLDQLCDEREVVGAVGRRARQARSLLKALEDTAVPDAEPSADAIERLAKLARRAGVAAARGEPVRGGVVIRPTVPQWAAAPTGADLVAAAGDALAELVAPRSARAQDGEVSRWWELVESVDSRRAVKGDHPQVPGPEHVRALALAFWAELAFRPAEAKQQLERLGAELPREWQDVRLLLLLRAEVRSNDAAVLARLVTRLEELGRDERVDAATRARSAHLLAVVHVRANHFDEAEEALHRALRLAGVGTIRTWILDTAGLLLLGLGGHEEARRVLEHVAAKKRAAGDDLGSAMTAGTLCLLDLEHGRTEAAAERARVAMSELGADLPAETRLRLATFRLQALLDGGATTEELDPAASDVRGLFDTTTAERRHIKGFAALALARAVHGLRQPALVREWLDRARDALSHADELVLVSYWEARLQPEVAARDGWLPDMRALFERAGRITSGEVLTFLFAAERAHRGGAPDRARELVLEGLGRAERANVRDWIERAEELFRRLDPDGLARHQLKRFTGRSPSDVAATRRAEVTVVVADLVGFSALATRLEPEQVMETVRGLWHLAVPLLARHHVRPVEYRGDMILAVAEGHLDGEHHAARALQFASDFVRRIGSVGAFRRAMGEAGLALRAGVASGQVITGLVGSPELFGFATIGAPTNVAARLQELAAPGEVVCTGDVARASRRDGECQRVELKGMEHVPLDAMRIRADRWQP